MFLQRLLDEELDKTGKTLIRYEDDGIAEDGSPFIHAVLIQRPK